MSKKPQKSYWIKSGFFSLFEKGSALLFGVGGIMILARSWDKDQFGLWILFALICSIMEVGRAGLQQNALVKYLSVAKGEEVGKITTASFFNSIAITVIIVLVLVFLGPYMAHWFNGEGLAKLLMIYCLTSTLLIFFQQFNFTQQANLEFEGIFWSNTMFRGSFFVYVLYKYMSGAEMIHEDLAWFQVYAAAAAAVVSFFFAKRFLSFSSAIDFSWVRKLFNFGAYSFGTNMSTMLHKNLDKLMVASILGKQSLAVYEWAIKMTMIIEVPTFSIASVVFPKSSQEFNENGRKNLAQLYEKSVGAILAIILPFMVIGYILAKEIIVLLATDTYLDSVPVLRIALLFGFLIPFAVMFGTVVDSMGKPKLNFAFTFVGFAINMVTNYFCIKKFGVIGAAYGTLFSWAILTFAGQIVLHRLLGVVSYKPFLHILPFYRDGYKKAMAQFSKKGLTLNEKL